MKTKKTFEQIEFIVPDYYLCALILGDFSGLTDSEEQEINCFIDKTIERYGNANFAHDYESEPYFSWRNDINAMGGNVASVTLLIEQK